MPHEIYDVNKVPQFFDQVGQGPYLELERWQRGYGRRPQRGRGILGIGKRIWTGLKPYFNKYIMPLARDALSAISSEGLDAGQKVLESLSKGEPIKEALTTAGTQAAKNLVKRAGVRLQQEGSGKRKPRSRSTLRLVGQSVLESAANKRGRRKNTLGLY